MTVQFFNMQARVAPVSFEAGLLNTEEPLYILGEAVKTREELFSVDDLHNRVRMRPARQSRTARRNEARSSSGLS